MNEKIKDLEQQISEHQEYKNKKSNTSEEKVGHLED